MMRGRKEIKVLLELLLLFGCEWNLEDECSVEGRGR